MKYLQKSEHNMGDPRLTTGLLQCSDYTILPKVPLGPVLTVVQREHAGIEVKVLTELLMLDEAYRGYFNEWLKELGLQRMAAEKLWPLTRDFSIESDATCRKPLPRSVDAEDVIINKYQLHYQIIMGSNLAMTRGISVIRAHLLAFRREFHKLDLTEQTPFVLGDAFHKPIKFFMDLAEELFNYFYSHYLKLDCGARHLDPGDLATLENYQKMLAPCEEFEEYLMYNLSYCHCLRPSQPCPEHVKPQQKSMEIQDAQRRALLSRCHKRLTKMSRKTDESINVVQESLLDAVDLEHELRMNQLTTRLAQLRETNSIRNMGHERNLVQQMIYALSPSLMPPSFHPQTFTPPDLHPQFP
ncbi:uncharacterized protein LOC135432171 [Drosophila montana]|uniref:uncharacterized protein LOC135432171 n=1 Tax=Drosophila montana TaxID=40370 RepID=UPI00313B62B2